ncbi:MAG TPA: hypothetical protein VGO78_26255 [Acidimicrobiales bacterium]|nr:hypothetical protein [Acidimicrobiales bacterium]
MRRGPVSNLLTPSLVIGTLLSVVSAFLLLLFDVTDFGLSFVIGLTGTTLAAVVDLIERSEYADVFRAPPWLRHEVARLGQSAQRVLAHGVPALDDELQAVVTRAAGDVELLANGRMERTASDTRHMLVLTAGAARRIAAITVVSQRDGANRVGWWATDFGKRYWQANLEALARGVAIDRAFVYESLDDGLEALADEQRQAGVNVFLMDAAGLAPQYRPTPSSGTPPAPGKPAWTPTATSPATSSRTARSTWPGAATSSRPSSSRPANGRTAAEEGWRLRRVGGRARPPRRASAGPSRR